MLFAISTHHFPPVDTCQLLTTCFVLLENLLYFLCFAMPECFHISSPLPTSTLLSHFSSFLCLCSTPCFGTGCSFFAPLPLSLNACLYLSTAPSVRQSITARTSVSQQIQSMSTGVPNWPVIWSMRPSWQTCPSAMQQVEADLYLFAALCTPTVKSLLYILAFVAFRLKIQLNTGKFIIIMH